MFLRERSSRGLTLGERVVVGCDWLFGRIWPSSRGSFSHSVYVRLVERLHLDTNALLLGYLAIGVPCALVALYDNAPALMLEVFFLLAPVAAWRVYSCDRYNARSAEDHAVHAVRDEARYFAETLLVVIVVSVLIVTAHMTASYDSRIFVSIAGVAYMTGIMARNSMSPRLVFVLTGVLSVPVFFGFLSLGGLFNVLSGLLVLGLPLHMSKIAFAGQSETVNAFVQAEVQADAADRLAKYDMLTGVANRNYLAACLEARLEEMRRSGRPVSLLRMDIDKFRQINESFGPSIGDELLRQAAARICDVAKSVQPDALVGRLGGDEFVVVVAGQEAPVADAVVSRMQLPYVIDAVAVEARFLVGVASADAGSDAAGMLKCADLALGAAKRAGHVCWRAYEPWMEERARRAGLFEERFRAALNENALEAYFQPIVDIATGETASFEALARWDDEVLGKVSPAEFIPFAEGANLSARVTASLMTQACLAMRDYDDATPVSVNVSVVEFKNPAELLATIRGALAASGLAPGRLWIEITEGVVISDFEAVLETLRGMRAMGVKIALDDFGVGYSSLSYLTRLGSVIDAIKIDKAFVDGAVGDRAQELIVTMVSALGRHLGARIVVEGIEDVAVARRMAELGATHAQGYLYGRPAGLLETAARRMREQGGAFAAGLAGARA